MQEVEAAPQLIENIDHIKLNKLEDNHNLYLSLMLKKPKPVQIEPVYPNANLYEKGRKYFVADTSTESIVYFMQWEDRKIFGKKAAYQVLVWSDAGVRDIRGFALGTFFDILLLNNDLIVTDRMQTHLGRRFWEMAIEKALRESFYVYALDLNKKTKQRIYNMTELKSDKYQEYWTIEKSGQAKLMAISKKALD